MRECEEKLVELLKTSEDEKQISHEFSLVVNSFTISTKELIAAIKADDAANKKMQEIGYYWIRKSTTQDYDDRNEIACRKCRELVEAEPAIKEKTEERKTLGYRVAELMARDHRTLQQTFTGFVFRHLSETDGFFNEAVKKAGYDSLGYLPLI